jgi:hypothetical protein
MAVLGGADEIVVCQSEGGGESSPDRGQFVAIYLRSFTLVHRGLLHLLAVLVKAGQEENLLPQAAPGSRNHVGQDHLVGMSKMGMAIDVKNGGGDVKLFAHSTDTLANERLYGNGFE